MTKPSQIYQEELDNHLIEPNEQQAQLIQLLDTMHSKLIHRQRQRNRKINTIRHQIKPRAPIQGIYLWGTVGTGKTYCLDLLFNTLPIKKTRMHFHQFMHTIHAQLTKKQGIQNPLRSIAKDIANQNILLFLDEFIVNDIADAMILGELLSHLFHYGLCLITTSNIPPQDLYLNGIQRERFLPAIALLKHNTTTYELTHHNDYRQQFIHQEGVYFSPLNTKTYKKIKDSFHFFAHINHLAPQSINILGRTIATIAYEKHYIWLDFRSLCSPPRSQLDYLELCKQFDVFFISDIPILSSHETKAITLFIYLIDILYDEKKGIVLSADSTPEELYTEGKKLAKYQRTLSRITEMCSETYTQQHLK